MARLKERLAEKAKKMSTSDLEKGLDYELLNDGSDLWYEAMWNELHSRKMSLSA